MTKDNLVERLAALPQLAGIPREELEWLASHGSVKVFEAGHVVAPKGKPIVVLWILLSGHVAIRVDRGAGLRHAMSWRTGDVGGMLPYSRMTGPPGDNRAEERTEGFELSTEHFTEMINRCPKFTALCVHRMIDRARSFNTSDLQDEKMMSLGRLAAGLAHEINNPASATVRSVKLLRQVLPSSDTASRELGMAELSEEALKAIEKVRTSCIAERVIGRSPIEQSDRHDEITEWLSSQKCDEEIADTLAETAVTIDELDSLAAALPRESIESALRWVSAGCTTYRLAIEIENAASRIHELVAAVKNFSYMDNLAGPELVDIGPGLRDTIKVMESKAKAKSATIKLNIDENLPRVYATGGELNQVWLNVIDNALDAIPDSGEIEISACRELDMVVVHVIDNGPGIPKDVMPHIFDPFFTTKQPGQGTGLGLDIARRLLRRYQGDIEFQSRPGRTDCRVSLIPDIPDPFDEK